MENSRKGPDHTAIRVALWRALHVEHDDSPHVLNDSLGALIANEPNWKLRPDMDPQWTSRIRPSIVARARFIEDLIMEEMEQGVEQYIILGAGLDTFALRQPLLGPNFKVFEIDEPITQLWKINRLKEMNIEIPSNLNFVPVNFENKESWFEKLCRYNFDPQKKTLICSTGVSMYLTHEANIQNLVEIMKFAKGSCFATTYMLPLEQLEEIDKPMLSFTIEKTKQAGTPFISFYDPKKVSEMALDCGFSKAEIYGVEYMRLKYFQNRSDNLCPGSGEYFLVAHI